MIFEEVTFHTRDGNEVRVGRSTTASEPHSNNVDIIIEVDGEHVQIAATEALLVAKAIERMVGKTIGFSVR